MILSRSWSWSALFLLARLLPAGNAWTNSGGGSSSLSRRQALIASTTALVGSTAWPSLGLAAVAEDYEKRERKSNKYRVIREDYWYMMGKTPPRLLNGPLKGDDPQWNAFGSCEASEGGSGSNSCTYVSLSQRIPAYSKYGFSIRQGAREYGLLGKSLREAAESNSESAWITAASYVTTLPQTPPPPPVDALLKMVLFASSMLTSPNFNGPSRGLLVARFYANEASFAINEIANAIDDRDVQRALVAWDFGKDSWNSFFQVVNGRITAKVGDKFEPIA